MRKFWQSGIGKRIREIQALEIPVHAAHTSYFIVLSVFPTLVLLLGILRYTDLQAADVQEFAEGFLPSALYGIAWDLISSTYENTSRLVVSISVLTALWTAGRGIYGLVKGLNAVYGVEEDRGWLRTRLMCAGYTFLFVLVLVLTLVLHVFGNTLQELLRRQGMGWFWLGIDLRFFLLVAVQTLLFCAMFMFLPGGGNGFRESLPGALGASVGWMSASTLFSVYVQYFPRYANIFGSVYTVALGMLWLYVCVCILFYGGVLNRLLKNMR